MPLTKSIIPVAGFGTRMLPAAKAVPKEMLPVLDRPTIQYVVEESSAAGINDVLLVTARDKRAIEDHFDVSPELENRLRASGREQLLAGLNSLMQKIHVHAVRQGEARGLGHAVGMGRQFVGNEPFLCMLGDTIFSGEPSPAAQLARAYEEFGTSVIGLEQVPPEKVDRYGIVGGDLIRPGILRLNTLVEKPSREIAPSNYAIAARYVLTPTIFQCLDETKPGKSGEIQLTDALRLLVAREPIHGVVLSAARHDIGNAADWLKTNLLFASRDAALWKTIEPTLRALLK